MAAPREGTFTRDLRINSSKVASSSDEAAVVRSPTHHPSSVGPGTSFSDPASLASTRQRREAAQLAGPRSPTAPYGSSGGVPLSTSPSYGYSHITSPAHGADRTNWKPLLSPTGRRRSRTYFSNNNLRTTLGVLAGSFILFVFLLNRSLHTPDLPESQPSSACEAQYDTLEPRAHTLHHTVHEGEHGDFPLHSSRASIALVTMADTRKVPLPKNLAYLSDIKPGSLVNILDVVWRNRQEYADRHGYTLVNGTDLVGKDRPPSWYKLKIVESVLDQHDWVFYLDPDAWITNPEIPLEAVLPAPGGADFVVTEDASGANAGSWVIRSSDWSREFLSRWWDMSDFIRPPGDTKSGDNDALKFLLSSMTSAEHTRRIAIPPQCALNSYLWRPSVRQWSRWFTSKGKVHSGIWRPGHLLVHLAGWDNYKGLMQLQKLFLNSHDLTRRSSSGLPLPRLSRKDLMPAPEAHPSMPTPVGVASGLTNSQTAASNSTLKSNEGAQEVATEAAAEDTIGSSLGSGSEGQGGLSLRRRASAVLGESYPGSRNPGASTAAAATQGRKSLWAGDANTGTNDGSKCTEDTEAGSSACGDGVERAEAGGADEGDYDTLTESEREDLGLVLSDPDADDLQAIDEMLMDDGGVDGDLKLSGDGDKDEDAGENEGEEEDEDYVAGEEEGTEGADDETKDGSDDPESRLVSDLTEEEVADRYQTLKRVEKELEARIREEQEAARLQADREAARAQTERDAKLAAKAEAAESDQAERSESSLGRRGSNMLPDPPTDSSLDPTKGPLASETEYVVDGKDVPVRKGYREVEHLLEAGVPVEEIEGYDPDRPWSHDEIEAWNQAQGRVERARKLARKAKAAVQKAEEARLLAQMQAARKQAELSAARLGRRGNLLQPADSYDLTDDERAGSDSAADVVQYGTRQGSAGVGGLQDGVATGNTGSNQAVNPQPVDQRGRRLLQSADERGDVHVESSGGGDAPVLGSGRDSPDAPSAAPHMAKLMDAAGRVFMQQAAEKAAMLKTHLENSRFKDILHEPADSPAQSPNSSLPSQATANATAGPAADSGHDADAPSPAQPSRRASWMARVVGYFLGVPAVDNGPIDPTEPEQPEERGGRPYEALEEMPGDDQDYEDHLEDVHSRVVVTPSMLQHLPFFAGPNAVRRIPRHTIFEMRTEEIDALEEDTQLSAETAKQLFGVRR